MRLSTILRYAGTRAAAEQVVALERAGLDTVWVAESHGFDSPTVMGYLAARTRRIEIGSGILNVFSRTPAAIAQTAAGLDALSQGRAVLGLGASVPSLIEGFHGVPYGKPLARTREVIEIVRAALRRETLVHHGTVFTLPLPAEEGSGTGQPLPLRNEPERAAVPIYVASVGPRSVESTAAHADGWLPFLFSPEGAGDAWGQALAAGRAARSPRLAPLEVCAGGLVAIGEDVTGLLDTLRPSFARHIGGMGPPGRNPYHDLACAYGHAAAADRIQQLYLAGHRREAEAAVPAELLDSCSLVGPESHVRERIAAFAEAGVTNLLLEPVGEQATRTVRRVREWLG